MHEISVLAEVINIVERIVEEQKVEKLEAIVLQIGELSSAIPKYMIDYFPVITEDKPFFKDTELRIETLPGKAKCQDCGVIFNVIKNNGYCPKCNSFDKTLLCGKEFLIKELVTKN